MFKKTLNQYVLQKATSFRCGIVLPPQKVENTFADIENIANVSVPENSIEAWRSASGGINQDEQIATISAIAEAMERYSAFLINFPVKKLSEIKNEKIITHDQFSLFLEEQYNNKNFPWEKFDIKEAFFGEVYSVYNNEKFWVPQELIGLGTKSNKAFLPSTSTGLAAHFNKFNALLLGIQEVLERDALTVYWLNSLGGREIKLDEKYTNPVLKKGGEIFCFDITQQWNPHPVVIVCGHLPLRNKKRISMGVACRPTYEEAIEKAYLEWIQGVIFAGFYSLYNRDLKLNKIEDIVDFDKHAVYYTLYPHLWHKTPLLKKRFSYQKQAQENKATNTIEILTNLIKQLKEQNIRLFYRDITIDEVRETGLNVIRVLSPELSLLHGDERAPFLGGRTADVKWRYPDLVNQVEFPNKLPHPLG